MLRRLKVTGLWSLEEIDLTLLPINVVLGANGSGKSSLLNVFRLLRAMVSRGMREFVAAMGGASSVLHYGPKNTRHATIELEFDGPKGVNGYAATLTFVAVDRLVFAEERVWYTPGDGSRREHTIGPGAHTESYLGLTLDAGDAAAPVARVVKWHLDRYCHHHFHDTSITASLRSACEVEDVSFLAADGANLAAFLRSMREGAPDAYLRVRDVVRRVFPSFDDFVIEAVGRGGKTVHLRWREEGNSYEFGPHHLSDGTLRFIAYAALLLQPGGPGRAESPTYPQIVVIDEPELGLHPSALALLGDLLQGFPAQRIIATQSVEMVGHLVTSGEELDRLVLVERAGRGSSFRRADPIALRPWLEDYAPGQLWTHGLLGALP